MDSLWLPLFRNTTATDSSSYSSYSSSSREREREKERETHEKHWEEEITLHTLIFHSLRTIIKLVPRGVILVTLLFTDQCRRLMSTTAGWRGPNASIVRYIWPVFNQLSLTLRVCVCALHIPSSPLLLPFFHPSVLLHSFESSSLTRERERERLAWRYPGPIFASHEGSSRKMSIPETANGGGVALVVTFRAPRSVIADTRGSASPCHG